jgi:hypothetical protein
VARQLLQTKEIQPEGKKIRGGGSLAFGHSGIKSLVIGKENVIESLSQ